MRHSRSMPEHAAAVLNRTVLLNTTGKKLSHNHKWPSTNIDSGIDSLYGGNDKSYRCKEDDSKKTRKQMPLHPSHQLLQPNLTSTSSSHKTQSLPRMNNSNEDYTCVVYTFGDEAIPYSTKILGKEITLKHFKEHLPKKGNFRYFFSSFCFSQACDIERIVRRRLVLPRRAYALKS